MALRSTENFEKFSVSFNSSELKKFNSLCVLNSARINLFHFVQ